MKLSQVFEQAIKDGFTMARDDYSYHGRKITNWVSEIEQDTQDYEYTTYPDGTGEAIQTNPFPSNEWTFWRD